MRHHRLGGEKWEMASRLRALPDCKNAVYPVAMQDIRNIVVLTGAGISAESGIATFRGPGGLWEGHRVEA
jgi:NAD-dependent SIR2 family protein deacetylase